MRVKTALVGIAFLGQANASCITTAPEGESDKWECTDKGGCCVLKGALIQTRGADPSITSLTSITSVTTVDKATDKATDKNGVGGIDVPEVVETAVGGSPVLGGSYCTYGPDFACWPGPLKGVGFYGHPSCCVDAKTCPVVNVEKCAPTAKTDDKTTVTTTDDKTADKTTDKTTTDDKTAAEAFAEKEASKVFCAGFNVKILPSEECPTDCMYCPDGGMDGGRRLLFATTPQNAAPKPKMCCPVHQSMMQG